MKHQVSGLCNDSSEGHLIVVGESEENCYCCYLLFLKLHKRRDASSDCFSRWEVSPTHMINTYLLLKICESGPLSCALKIE